MKRICVFCGSSPGKRTVYEREARRLGELLAQRGIGLVYGGGKVGLMGSLADTVLENGGEVIGVIPHGLAVREVAHRGVTELRIVDSMHERKATMVSLADAFVSMPGGFGTIEEMSEVVTWVQLGIHRKPCGILNVDGYFDGYLSFIDHAVEEGFLQPMNRGLFVVETTAEAMLDALSAFDPPAIQKWLDMSET